METSIYIPYGTGTVGLDTRRHPVKAVLRPENPCLEQRNAEEMLRAALCSPIGAKPLWQLAAGAKRLLLITSDHTRPQPSKITLPMILEQARRGNPDLDVILLIATGCHRAMTRAEMEERFGNELLECETILNHNAFDRAAIVHKGTMPSGQELHLNKLVDWADLVISEGFIEPHFFAGFSGGRKSVLPGIAHCESVFANHCADFIAAKESSAGSLTGNPIHTDMLYAAQAAHLRFICNVVLDSNQEIEAVFAGDPLDAHARGCAYVENRLRVRRVPGDIVISSNGGYPLDQNIYQTVKGMTAAEACARPGGVIILVARCADGHGGEDFLRYFSGGVRPQEILRGIKKTPAGETKPDQWQAQILARILAKHRVIMVTDPKNRRLVEQMQMDYAERLDDAVDQAKGILHADAEVVVIPDGVGVIVRD